MKTDRYSDWCSKRSFKFFNSLLFSEKCSLRTHWRSVDAKSIEWFPVFLCHFLLQIWIWQLNRILLWERSCGLNALPIQYAQMVLQMDNQRWWFFKCFEISWLINYLIHMTLTIRLKKGPALTVFALALIILLKAKKVRRVHYFSFQ